MQPQPHPQQQQHQQCLVQDDVVAFTSSSPLPVPHSHQAQYRHFRSQFLHSRRPVITNSRTTVCKATDSSSHPNPKSKPTSNPVFRQHPTHRPRPRSSPHFLSLRRVPQSQSHPPSASASPPTSTTPGSTTPSLTTALGFATPIHRFCASFSPPVSAPVQRATTDTTAGSATRTRTDVTTATHDNVWWDGLRRVVKVSALSASLLLAPTGLFTISNTNNTSSSPSSQLTSTDPTAATITTRTATGHETRTGASLSGRVVRVVSANAAVASSATSATSAGSSDVEVAAMTLGAVTLGGLLMRTLVHYTRDRGAERQRLEAECKRLQDEEENRALRAERQRLESTPASISSRPPSPEAEEANDRMMSELRKRLQSLEQGEDQDREEQETDGDSGNDGEKDKKDMRYTPIPDRGTGSAVLERPDNQIQSNNNHGQQEEDKASSGSADEGSAGAGAGAGAAAAKPDELEMLKRMWNMSPPDKEKE